MNSTQERSFRFSEACEGNAEQLEELEKNCFSNPWSEDDFAQALARKDIYVLPVVYDGEELIGYAVLCCVFEDAELQNLAVGRAYRRGGLGERLLDVCLEQARSRGAQRIFLEVREGNTAARRLYEKKGFALCGRRKNYYRLPTEDALLMTRKL